jgi:uncharacterized protein YbdZ (MbtH family)
MSTKHRFIVIVNTRQQCSLWPTELPVPGGWARALGLGADPASCLAWIERLGRPSVPLVDGGTPSRTEARADLADDAGPDAAMVCCEGIFHRYR